MYVSKGYGGFYFACKSLILCVKSPTLRQDGKAHEVSDLHVKRTAMKKITGVYMLRNKVTGDFYIGSSVNITERWKTHFRDLNRGTHYNKHLQRAYAKYAGNFEAVVLAECDPEDLQKNEQHYIDSLRPAYNKCPNAYTLAGLKKTVEQIANIAKSLTGHPVAKETREKLKTANLGKRYSDETRQKLSDLKRGVPWSEHRRFMGNPKGDKSTPASREKQRLAITGRKASAETKSKMSEAQKSRFQRNPRTNEAVARGEKCGSAKLNDKKVIEIRRLYKKGETIKHLAEIYGMGTTTIGHVVHYETWKHVVDEE